MSNLPGSYSHISMYIYIASITQTNAGLLAGKDDEVVCCSVLHEAYRCVIGVVAWTVLTRAELAVYVQALQRRAHALGIKDCRRLSLVLRHMERHKCGLKSIALKHPLKFVGLTDAAFKAQPGESIGLATRGLAATLQEGTCDQKPMSSSGKANSIDFTVGRQRSST